MSSSSPDLIRELHRILVFGLLESQKYWVIPAKAGQKSCQLFWVPGAHSFPLSSTNSSLMDVAHLISEAWQCLTYVTWKTHKYVAISARPAVSTSNNRSFKPCPKPSSFLMAEKVGSASHLQERKGGSSWKLLEQVNWMQKSVEEGIHISLLFISWGRSLASHPLS